MKLLLGVALALLGFALADDTDLELQWAVDDGSVVYDDTTGIFTFQFGHGDGDMTGSDPVIMVYGQSTGPTDSLPNRACPTVDPAAHLVGDVVDPLVMPEFTTISLNTVTPPDPDPRITTWEFRLAGPIATNSYIFLNPKDPTEPNQALVSLCIRFGMTDSLQAGNPLVSFKELGVDIDIDLDANMEVLDFQTQAYRPEKTWEDLEFTAFAKLCPVTSPPNFYYQNEGIPICVCTADVPTVAVQSVETLTIDQLDGPGGNILAGGLKQELIIDGVKQTSTVSILECEDDLADGTHCCKVEVIPNAAFFPRYNSALDVRASGVAILEIDGVVRHLRLGHRDLVETTTAEYETDISLHGDETDAAVSPMDFVTAVVLAVGGFLV